MAAVPLARTRFLSNEATGRAQSATLVRSAPIESASRTAEPAALGGGRPWPPEEHAEWNWLVDRLEEEFQRRISAEQSARDAERQLVEMESMQALVWQAASAVHDINNLMAITVSGAEWMLRDLEADDPKGRVAEEIRSAGLRAVDLVHRLLESAHPARREPVVCDLNELLHGAESMMRHVLGAEHQLVFAPASCLGRTRADPTEVENMLLNLVANARDAMPQGGKVTIRTRNADASDDDTRADARALGPTVVIEVTDTGVGMDPETAARIFEPFFTTKPARKGTGLGLFSVLRTVREHDGHIFVRTEPASGTTFEIHLPRIVPGLPSVPPPPRSVGLVPVRPSHR